MVRNNTTMMEIIARAFGARYPAIVAQRIAPECPNVPAAMQSLRERMPQWFEPVQHEVSTSASP